MDKDVRCVVLLMLALALVAGQSQAEIFWSNSQRSDLVQADFGDTVGMGSDKDCGGATCVKACCLPPWAHRTGIFGEYLLLRSNEGEVAYGVLADNVGSVGENIIQQSRVFTVDPDYSSNYRLGGTLALSSCSSIQLTFTDYYGSDSDAVSFDPAQVGNARIFPLSLHPFPQNAAQPTLDAAARSAISFETVDIDYRSVWWANQLGALNYLVGARYANLDQRYGSMYTATGIEHQTRSDVGFDGGGIRFGLDGERHHGHTGLLLYGRSILSLVAGEFRARYQYQRDVDPGVNLIDTAWEADRIMTMVDLELGVGWQSRCGHFRVTSGYMISSWFNAVTTDQWIRSVSRNNFVGQPDGMSYDTLMFDGLTVRAEYRF
jgi:hypothetical protein